MHPVQQAELDTFIALLRAEGVGRYLEVGSRHRDDLTTCSDIDMMSANSDGRFVHKDGTPYPE